MVGEVSIARAATINGWMNIGELYWLATHAKDAKIVVEAGCLYGRSTRALCDNTDGFVHAVDPWNGNYGRNISKDGTFYTYLTVGSNAIFNQFLTNMADHLSSGKCMIHIMEFHECSVKGQPDMIFIDANHDYENVKHDIKHALSMMSHGLLCGHDFNSNWPGVVEAVTEEFRTGFGVHESIWYVTL